jgi:ribosomal protein S27AE
MSPASDPNPKKKARRRKGRERGSKNIEREVVRHAPARCPNCLCTEWKRERIVGRQEHQGTAPDGGPYTRIMRWRARCKNCGQGIVLTEYLNQPEGTAA